MNSYKDSQTNKHTEMLTTITLCFRMFITIRLLILMLKLGNRQFICTYFPQCLFGTFVKQK
ncbi:hypothetical protein MAR_032193 [Mya arenaria]|uniref:Uncharacterized protein n=1 Tax=Mya arenaria TaxID=6604 RepID=A0ABY7F9Y2_MYAAR|nr:hypothetical protein MAR_032193 [Mya arenaria]